MAEGFGTSTVEGGEGFTYLGVSNVGSQLLSLLVCDAIVPGAPPSYETCKTIYEFHPLGAKMVDGPIQMAQSQERELTVSVGPEERLIPAFRKEWQNLGVIGADTIIANCLRQSKIYGISTLGLGDRSSDSAQPIDWENLHELDLYFNVLDPLNTAGSLVLEQDPNSPDYQKPKIVQAAGKTWHPSRTVVMMNEQPIYISFTSSSFGFVGRSTYQRALFPLKSFVQSMITDDMVTKKIGLLVWKAKSPSSAISERIRNVFSWKRQQLQGGMTGNVLQIGAEEDVQSLNFNNLEGAGRFTRDNILKNIAAAANMPARMLDQETLAGNSLADGTEDAKAIARYVDRVRIEMQPLYTFMDNVVMRRAWSPDFFKDIQKDYPDYRNVSYQEAFYQWKNGFTAIWPNLLVEPDSEKAEAEEARFKSAVAVVEVATPLAPTPQSKAALLDWLQDEVNSRKELFAAPLQIDIDEVASYEPPNPLQSGDEEGNGGKEPKPVPFSYES